MKTITLQVPDSFDVDTRELALLIATRLYEQGKLSLGQAAEVAGYSKRTFMELLSRYSVSLFTYSAEELETDINNAKNYHL